MNWAPKKPAERERFEQLLSGQIRAGMKNANKVIDLQLLDLVALLQSAAYDLERKNGPPVGAPPQYNNQFLLADGLRNAARELRDDVVAPLQSGRFIQSALGAEKTSAHSRGRC